MIAAVLFCLVLWVRSIDERLETLEIWAENTSKWIEKETEKDDGQKDPEDIARPDPGREGWKPTAGYQPKPPSNKSEIPH